VESKEIVGKRKRHRRSGDGPNNAGIAIEDAREPC